ncbi:MAG: hypothetical protein O6942_03915 [Bacteroidetes bacterium]|nr:hypothetical protein [Bacteroidota bacterium]
MRFLVLFSVLVGLSVQTQAQVKPGVSVQIYPAGQIVQAKALIHNGVRTDIRLYVGVNRARRKDYGKKDHEEGLGAGVGIDLAHLTGSKISGVYYGGKLDLWYLNIDWEHVENPCPPSTKCLAPAILRTGETKIFVVQPTATLGYRYALKNGSAALEFSVSLGAEINAYTDGDPVGEGLILLGGLAIDF